MFKFRQVSPLVGAIIALSTALGAVLPGLAHGQTTVSVERAGTPGTARVLFIPGLATDGEVWTATVDALSGRIDAHIATLAGFGSVAPLAREGGVIETAVTDLAHYLAAEDLHDLMIVGHSLGGQIALQLAAAAPDRVGQVVVVDSAPFFARLFNPAITPEQARGYGTMMAAQMGAASREQFLSLSRQGLAVQSITADGQARVMGWMEASDQATVAQAMGEVMSTDFSPVLDEVTVPVSLVVAWSEGMPVGAAALESVYAEQYAALDTLSLHRIDGSRHFIMLDQPEAFRSLLATILDGGQ